MGADAFAYGVIGYKLDSRERLYKPKINIINECCKYNLNKSHKFCPDCGTQLDQFKLNKIDDYDGESLFDINVYDRHYYTDDMNLPVIIYHTKIYSTSPAYKKGDDMKKMDLSKMDESKEKIKEVLNKLGIVFEEDRFGVWIISHLSC